MLTRRRNPAPARITQENMPPRPSWWVEEDDDLEETAATYAAIVNGG